MIRNNKKAFVLGTNIQQKHDDQKVMNAGYSYKCTILQFMTSYTVETKKIFDEVWNLSSFHNTNRDLERHII